VVDAFSYGKVENCNAYFLSHYHYDHFIGLNKHFANQMYCSIETAQLVIKHLGVNPKYVQSLPLNKFIPVEGSEQQVDVALIDANQY
jgi:DNA cross-link repair 1A protein